MAEPPIIALRGVSLGYGANPLFEDVELQLLPGERATLVGRNGCGKTTIMKLMAGCHPTGCWRIVFAARHARFILAAGTAVR